jgi:hypothetical protein
MLKTIMAYNHLLGKYLLVLTGFLGSLLPGRSVHDILLYDKCPFTAVVIIIKIRFFQLHPKQKSRSSFYQGIIPHQHERSRAINCISFLTIKCLISRTSQFIVGQLKEGK